MSEDLIKRTDAIKALHEEWNGGWLEATGELVADNCEAVLNRLPSADRPQGEWKRRLVDNGFNADWVCSECGYRVKTDFVSFNFCPHCGARMKGADDD